MLRARVPSCGGCRRGLCACRSHGRWVVRIANRSAALGRARGWRRLARAGVPCRSRAARVSRGPCQLRGRGARSASTSRARGIRASRRCGCSLPTPPALIHDDATLGHHEVAHVLLVSLLSICTFDVSPVDVLAVGVTLAHGSPLHVVAAAPRHSLRRAGCVTPSAAACRMVGHTLRPMPEARWARARGLGSDVRAGLATSRPGHAKRPGSEARGVGRSACQWRHWCCSLARASGCGARASASVTQAQAVRYAADLGRVAMCSISLEPLLCHSRLATRYSWNSLSRLVSSDLPPSSTASSFASGG